LELIVASNETDFTLAEIEGDAVLFYCKGEPLRREQLIDQCLRMFANFHQRLMVIERDTVCQCGACQTASNLTLKFIVHFGYIKEIKVAQFVKATGIDTSASTCGTTACSTGWSWSTRREYTENRARYSEKVEIPEINLTLLAHYEMEARGEASTRLNFNVNWLGATLPAEKKQGMMAGQAANFELFKHVCETNPA
jgi:hypothetical protein